MGGRKALRILSLGPRWRRVQLWLRERIPGTLWIVARAGSRDGLDVLAKREILVPTGNLMLVAQPVVSDCAGFPSHVVTTK
jgi:hypothetical protein